MLPPLFEMSDAAQDSEPTRAWLRPAGFSLACALGTFLVSANDGQIRHGALYGIVLLLGAIFGFLSATGLLTPASDAVPLSQTTWFPLADEPAWAAPKNTVPIAVILLLGLGFFFGPHGLPLAIAIALAVLLVSALRRPALFVFVAASALYLPMLGAYGLWDPWETHYGEVTREILSRDDWISLWWAQDKWFWSKPILIFWAEALTWSASGLGFRPDENPQHVEWVLRLPIYGMSMLGLMSVYGAVARIWTRRAGVLAALVLATTPYYSMLTHQAITDMPFVSNMTVAMMLLTLGLVEDPERKAGSIRIGRYALSAQHVVIALVLLVGLPQVFYLASRNITFIHGLFAWHRDSFMFGSGYNADVPGNFGIHDEVPAVRAIVLEPLGQALGWSLGLGAIVWQLRKEARLQQLYMFAFYVFCALAFMAKGIPGFALPGLVAFLCLAAMRRFDLLWTGKLRVSVGMLIVTVLGMPWFIAMYVRHGEAFPDRILIHDHINRLTTGVHGDNGTIEYFICQLGYGLFPWIALLPAALGSWLLDPEAGETSDQARAQRNALYTMGLWFAVAFTLFSAMTTKFHHYIFPAVPPTAVLIGLLVDRMLPRAQLRLNRLTLSGCVAAFVAPLLLVLGVAGLRGNVRGILPSGLPTAQSGTWAVQHGWPVAVCIALIAAGALLFAWNVRLWNRVEAGANEAPTGRYTHAAMSVALLGGAVLAAFVGRDLSWRAGDPPGDERLIHLFVYNYGRPWPEQFDYRAILGGFALVAVALLVVSALRTLRKAAILSLLGLSLALTLFSLDVYMIDLAPHWGQAELVHRYYQQRKSAKEPLVAWQMNWKGENFYTGNRVAVFVDLDNKKVEDWMKQNKGTRAFFLLEHSRLERFKQMLAPRAVKPLTTVRDCNKFILVSAQL
jgi:4-amino-4-deoxy-L-arabinose transferase-like glycosyltransferase